MAQIWTVEAWAHEVGAARANYFPNINIAAFLGFETLKYSTILSTNSMTGGADPAFSLPIYTAGVIQANIDAKMASFLSALYEYNDLILKSAQEVTDLLVLAKSIYAQQREQTTIVKSATARYNLIELRQLNGLDNELQVYALQVEVLQKKIANLDLIYGQYRAAIKLIKALGGGYCAE
jgi:outer membrane protein TolC